MMNETMNEATAIESVAFPATAPTKAFLPLALLGASAIALALLCIPGVGRAQGVVRGAERGSYAGSYEGGRVAGPVGAAVGGAVGAGVGGAIGAVDGALGIPYRHPCHGYYNRYGHWRCYRY